MSLTPSDRTLLNNLLAGFTLADGVEAEDIEDALYDATASFNTFPVTTLVFLRDPEGQPMIPTRNLEDLARTCCAAYGLPLNDFTIFRDPESVTSGSIRVRVGEWDVFDLGLDLSADEPLEHELRQIEAIAQRVAAG